MAYRAAASDEVQFSVVEEPGVLQRVVHPLGQGIVQGVACLCHADLCTDAQQHLHVLLRRVLDTPVRVVYQSGGVDTEACIALDGHRQRPCGAVGLQ